MTPSTCCDLRQEASQRYLALPPLPGMIYGAFDPFAWAADPDRRTDYWVAGVAAPSASDHDDPAVIHGCAGAVGEVEGVVRRLDDFDQAGELQPGEILVTHLTNIGWTPLFPRAAAVITDLGAPLSHAAIVARELGIPAVVGCGDATARLRTGDRVVGRRRQGARSASLRPSWCPESHAGRRNSAAEIRTQIVVGASIGSAGDLGADSLQGQAKGPRRTGGLSSSSDS